MAKKSHSENVVLQKGKMINEGEQIEFGRVFLAKWQEGAITKRSDWKKRARKKALLLTFCSLLFSKCFLQPES